MEIELKNFPIDFDIFIEDYTYIFQIRVGFFVKERNTGNRFKIYYDQSFDKESYNLPQAVRETLINALTHEVEECLLVNSERVFDPHFGEKEVHYA